MADEPGAAAQMEIWRLIFAYYKSACLKAALDLGIPDALHRLGGRAAVADLHSALSLPPERLRHFARLMRVTAAATGLFADHGDAVYGLTPASRLLLKGGLSMYPMAQGLLHRKLVAPCFGSLSEWLKDPTAPATAFETMHGDSIWGEMLHDAEFNDAFNAAMASGMGMFNVAVLEGHRHVFAGLTTLVDVGGGVGVTAAAIADAFPEIKCSVLDIPQVISTAPTGGRVEFIAGDMFAHIPPNDAILLKNVLHNWDDEACIKILERCRDAIPAEGKVIIIDFAAGGELESFFDLEMMALVGGQERDEAQWSRLIKEAGFSSYKISSVVGSHSIIEAFL